MLNFNDKKGFICDMDGVIYHGNKILPGVPEFIDWLQRTGKEYLFLTNNSGCTPLELKQKLARMGLDVPEARFYTSALATAAFIRDQSPGCSAYVIGEAGLLNALYDAGITMNDVNPDYGRDEMPIYGTRIPEASVDAMTTEEIAAVMKLCYENNIPVTTRGAGTGLVGGCVPVMGGVVIATTKMNKILGYDLDNYTVTVQPGVLLQQLAEDALSHECLYPPDPGEKLEVRGHAGLCEGHDRGPAHRRDHPLRLLRLQDQLRL